MSTHTISTAMRAALLCLLCLPLAANSQTVIPYVAELQADGERDDATLNAALELEVSGSYGTATVYVAHDAEGLFCAFVGALQANFQFPEVLIDPDLGRGESWQADDIWIHVSGSDCASIGEHSNYTNCAPEQPEWIGVPNFSQTSAVNYLEIYLPFDFLGLQPAAEFGLAFDVTNTAGSYSYWPEGATIDVPATWSMAQLEAVTTDLADDSDFAFDGRVTNPGAELHAWISDAATIRYSLSGFAPGELQLQLNDLQGRCLLTQPLSLAGPATQHGRLPAEGLSAGVYIFQVRRPHAAPLTQLLLYRP